VPAAVITSPREEERFMAGVMIGVDPHKASHTAVAISGAEEQLGQLRVRGCAVRVLDVQPQLGARVRLLDGGNVNASGRLWTG
jgi:hypothetical protein